MGFLIYFAITFLLRYNSQNINLTILTILKYTMYQWTVLTKAAFEHNHIDCYVEKTLGEQENREKS